MTRRISSILGIGLTLATAVQMSGAEAQSPPVVGSWANDHGSTLVISAVGADGSLTGTYSNNAPGYKCAGIAFPLVGWMEGPRISYTVRWKNASADCASITSWTGYFNDGRLGVEWVLSYEENGGSRVRVGSDSYRRQ